MKRYFPIAIALAAGSLAAGLAMAQPYPAKTVRMTAPYSAGSGPTVFMRLLRRGFPPDFHKNPSAYLYRAAINESLNILRTQKRRPTTKLEGVDVPATVSASTSGEITQRKVYEAIGALNPKDAEVVILRYAHDYSDAEIAELLGKSRVNIAVRLHRARAQLKNLLRTSLGEKP